MIIVDQLVISFQNIVSEYFTIMFPEASRIFYHDKSHSEIGATSLINF